MKYGDFNGNGWQLLSIQYLYNGRYIEKSEYYNLIKKDRKRKNNDKFRRIIKILLEK